jgi:hypothetical protein
MVQHVDDDTPVEAALAGAIEQHRGRKTALTLIVALAATITGWYARRRRHD